MYKYNIRQLQQFIIVNTIIVNNNAKTQSSGIDPIENLRLLQNFGRL